MNKSLRRLSVVMMAMFLTLLVSTTYTQFVAAEDLNADGRNSRTLYREFGRDRGPILVSGEAVAHSVPADDEFRFQRVYEDPELYAPITGFYSITYGATGIEKAETDALNGTSDALFYDRVRNLFTGEPTRGGSVELTIDATAQEAAAQALGDQVGAVVALDPSTGEILAMVSSPSFDPNKLSAHDTKAVTAAYEELNDDPARPMENRAISGRLYPPGSVFKLVTAAAALESGDWSAKTVVEAPVELELPQTSSTIKNYGGASCDPNNEMPLADALRISCNTAFASLGMELGTDAMAQQSNAFGFGVSREIPLKVSPSTFPDELNPPQLAQSSIGQFDVRVTPLEVAMISAAIANDGIPMAPHLVKTVRNSDLSVRSRTNPEALARAVSSSTARSLREMMVSVVESGTGQSAQISGVDVAGKTGTAQTSPDKDPHAWFTAFAPADDPQVAVAVVVEHGGSMGSEATGGRTAAPIAKAVIEAVLE
ncbi:MAG TPA: penicillin-binding transpeptidase domain-containing protein [Actinomycetales bacterium]|nr:penicillin-binding transpeptidase domain-containing protein [Actinomycetales bacterium]